MDRRRFLAAGASAPLASAATTHMPVPDRTLRVAFPSPETGFDPAQVQDAYSGQVNAHIFDAPLRWDYMARPARLVPNTTVGLPEVSSDFRTYTLRLRPGIWFHDDPAFKGQRRELVAEDYVYSIKRVFDPRWKSQMLFELEPAKILGVDEVRQRALKGAPFDYAAPVEGLRALDRYTLRIRLAEPAPRFVNTLTLTTPLGAVAREVVEAYGDRIMEHPVGTGPFRLAHWTRTSRIVLVRNPTYRDETWDFEPPADEPALAADAVRLRGRKVPLVDRVEVTIVQESQPRWLSFDQGALDLLAVPFDYVPIAAPNRELAPHLARRGVRLQATPLADITLAYFNMEDPVVGGYAPEKVALRRAVSLAFDSGRYIREIYRGSAVAAESPIVPGTFGFDPAFRTELSEYSPARAKALLDTYGYVDRNGDGWREQPDGSPLVLEMAASTSQLDRRQNEQWKRCMDAVGLKMEFRVAQWAELLKQSLAGRLMMWGFAWQAGDPDSDLFFSLAYSPNLGSSNDARFSLKAYDDLYAQQHRLPDGPERLALLREASRLLVAYMPYKFIAHRIELDLSQPWVLGFRRPLFMTRLWAYLDIDAAVSRG
jgi:peptide/nickel transport system substrate-binding protein